MDGLTDTATSFVVTAEATAEASKPETTFFGEAILPLKM
jgi:hypothetical protein